MLNWHFVGEPREGVDLLCAWGDPIKFMTCRYLKETNSLRAIASTAGNLQTDFSNARAWTYLDNEARELRGKLDQSKLNLKEALESIYLRYGNNLQAFFDDVARIKEKKDA